MRAILIILTASLALAGPALSQGRGDTPPAPPTTPNITGPHAFKAPAGSVLILRDGRPKWEVYNDCSWAYFAEVQKAFRESQRLDAVAAEQEASEAADRAAQDDPTTANVTYNPWLTGLGSVDTRQQAMDMSQKGLDLKVKTDQLSELAAKAYMAQTGASKAEADKIMLDTKAVASLSVDACKILLPSG